MNAEQRRIQRQLDAESDAFSALIQASGEVRPVWLRPAPRISDRPAPVGARPVPAAVEGLRCSGCGRFVRYGGAGQCAECGAAGMGALLGR